MLFFGILFSACLLIFSVFPELSISLASLLGIYSSTNFIFFSNSVCGNY
ncbi:MAG: DUF2304 family protein [Blautia obeum]